MYHPCQVRHDVSSLTSPRTAASRRYHPLVMNQTELSARVDGEGLPPYHDEAKLEAGEQGTMLAQRGVAAAKKRARAARGREEARRAKGGEEAGLGLGLRKRV